MTRVSRVLPLVALSGCCALIYQILWMRHLRLIFGASTGASAAVLAIFMGGLGLGSIWLGRRADRHSSPLALYGRLELGIAVSAALSPLLIDLTRMGYYALGGRATLGLVGGSFVQLTAATLVLSVPTFLMGGTLPAIARAVQSDADTGRRALGRVYALNSLGAVTGSLLANFVLIEVFGISQSLWLAAGINALVALVAISWARDLPAVPTNSDTTGDRVQPSRAQRSRGIFVCLAAAVVGFVFFAMEMVWYRILASLLGGSAYAFGAILAVALMGISLGAWIFGRRAPGKKATLSAFAVTCALESVLLLVPFAWGDDIAFVALSLRSWSVFGFWGIVGSWMVVISVVVFPAALVAGYQFPLLVSVLGRGGQSIGRQVGLTYLWNTAGAIAGAVASGFGLLAWLGASTLWVGLALLASALAGAALLVARSTSGDDPPATEGGPRHERNRYWLAGVGISLSLLLATATGPTAAWRHLPIGAGRVSSGITTVNQKQEQIRSIQRGVVWERDGREVGVAITDVDSLSFVVSGKTDGNIRGDAGTQVMCGLLGAIHHPNPQNSLVIGLGTGMSAGWLAQVPSMTRVDVVELEPAIVEMARRASAANHDALANEKLVLHIADGREFLQTHEGEYDVIMSEPSNPYRAGIASLFSQNFYHSVAARMNEDSVFVQWVQAYEVDGQTLATVMATLASVFPSVEVWSTQTADLALIARKSSDAIDVEMLARHSKTEPFRSALEWTWGVRGLTGLLAGFRANGQLAALLAQQRRDLIDTDDRPQIEFGFSRNLGGGRSLSQAELERVATRFSAHRPSYASSLDWQRVREAAIVREIYLGVPVPEAQVFEDPARRARMAARRHFRAGRYEATVTAWSEQSEQPFHYADRLMLARAHAMTGNPAALTQAESISKDHPTDAALIISLYEALEHGRAAGLLRAVELAREDPWFDSAAMKSALAMGMRRAASHHEFGRRLFAALETPFAVAILNEHRLWVRVELAKIVDFDGLCTPAFAAYEPQTPWNADFLSRRVRCYAQHGDPALLARAEAELSEFMAAAVSGLEATLLELGAETMAQGGG